MDNEELSKMDLDEWKALFNADIETDDIDYYMFLASKLANDDSGLKYLLSTCRKRDDLRIRATLFGISIHSAEYKQEILELLNTYLSHQNPLIISEAIDGLIEFREKSSWKSIEPMLNHESEFVRGAVIRYVRNLLENEKAFDILIPALNDRHQIVRQNAIDELVELGDKRAIKYIAKLVSDDHPDVQSAAKTGIEDLNSL